MSHIRIDKQKAVKKWTPVLENMGVSGDRVEWLAEYAEFHSIHENAYANSTTAGLGTITAPSVSGLPGYLGGGAGFGGGSLPTQYGGAAGVLGSGDLGQNLLPVAMKIAAQTIGLDLVAVKPTPGPKIDLLYIDFQYDDLTNGTTTGRPQVFKITNSTSFSTVKTALTTAVSAGSGTLTQGGIQGTRVFVNTISLSAALTNTEPASSKAGVLEFLGFSRIDGAPMFKAYRQSNAQAPYGGLNTSPYYFEQSLNTFNPTASMVDQINWIGTTGVTASVTIELVSVLEDHLPGFSANWASSAQSGDYPMSRQTEEDTYSGVIGPKISSKSIAVGTIEVSTALRRTEIEDIKANTGMDIVQKMESILVNELSQTISKQIVAKIFGLGETNRQSAPLASWATAVSATPSTIFDLDTNYVTANGGVGGETTHAVQRKLITKLAHASNFIATEGRVGPAQFAVTNGDRKSVV